MDSLRDPADLSVDEIEQIEKQSLRWLFQAATDFGFDAWDVFYQSPDDVKDVAEDITREMLDRIGGYQIHRRILGNVDYRKARYVILPEFAVRQALFIDSKAEKSSSSATLQMSQVSMEVRQSRSGVDRAVRGRLPTLPIYNGHNYLSTMMLAHFEYEDIADIHHLRRLTLAALPNGLLQERYNPSADDTIWNVGRNAESLNEDFRVRLSFRKLGEKCPWRVQRVNYDANARTVSGDWREGTVDASAIGGQ